MDLDTPVDYAVKVECRSCGRPISWIYRRQGYIRVFDGDCETAAEPMPELWSETNLDRHRDCGEFTPPDRVSIERAIAVARAKPVRPGQPYDGRTARVRGSGRRRDR
jgi:hypothetical protein